MTMADQVAVMNGGRVEQLGAPADLYEHPRSTFVANFLGTSNLIEARITDASGDELRLKTEGDGGTLRLPAARCSAQGARAGDRVLIGVRPEKISLSHADDPAAVPAGRNRLAGTIRDAGYLGVSTQYLIDTPVSSGITVYAQNMERDTRLSPGAEVVLHWQPAHTFAMDSGQDAEAGTAEPAEEAMA